MALFTWNRQFELGVPELDMDHIRLFDLADRLHADLGQGSSGGVLRERFAGLLDQLRAHFAAEEKQMERSQYSELAIHRQEHRRIVDGALLLQAESAASPRIYASRTLQFLHDALHTHIDGDDRRFARYLLGTQSSKSGTNP